jgi:hypothetical protein
MCILDIAALDGGFDARGWVGCLRQASLVQGAQVQDQENETVLATIIGQRELRQASDYCQLQVAFVFPIAHYPPIPRQCVVDNT